MGCHGRWPRSGRLWPSPDRPPARGGIAVSGEGDAPYAGPVATLEDLEARVAALEAERADYRAVLTAMNALGANQRDHALRLSGVESRLTAVESAVTNGFAETSARIRSLEDGQAEIKDLLIRALDH